MSPGDEINWDGADIYKWSNPPGADPCIVLSSTLSCTQHLLMVYIPGSNLLVDPMTSTFVTLSTADPI